MLDVQRISLANELGGVESTNFYKAYANRTDLITRYILKQIEIVKGEFTLDITNSIMKIETKSGGKIIADISKPIPWHFNLEGDLMDIEVHIY